MNVLDYIKSLDYIRNGVFLSGDDNEKNPVDVYFDSVQWLYYTIDLYQHIRIFQLNTSVAELNVYKRDEILKSTLGTIPKDERVTEIDIFLHGKYIREINYANYSIQLNLTVGSVDGQGQTIFSTKGLHNDVVDNIITIYNKLANLSLVDDYLLDSELCTQEQRELIMEALYKYGTMINKDAFIMEVINQFEKDFAMHDYTAVYEVIKLLYDFNDNNKDILKGFLSE